MGPGESYDPPRPINREAFKHLGRHLLRREVIGVVQHALNQDAGAHDQPLAADLPFNSLNVGALVPVHEAPSSWQYDIAGAREARLEGRLPGCGIAIAGKWPSTETTTEFGSSRRHALAEPRHARGGALSSPALPI